MIHDNLRGAATRFFSSFHREADTNTSAPRPCVLCESTDGPLITIDGYWSEWTYCTDIRACDERRGAFNSRRA